MNYSIVTCESGDIDQCPFFYCAPFRHTHVLALFARALNFQRKKIGVQLIGMAGVLFRVTTRFLLYFCLHIFSTSSMRSYNYLISILLR